MKIQPNQFVAPTAPIVAPLVLERSALQKARVDDMVDFYKKNPHMCLIPQHKYVYIRDPGKSRKKMRCSTRALVYYAVHQCVPAFGTPSCGMVGCINPAHQTKIEAEGSFKKVDR